MAKWYASGIMALTMLVFFVASVLQDIRATAGTDAELPTGLVLRYALAMTLGGALSGFLLRGLFGRGGVLGWLLALLGGLFASLIAGIFGSAFGLLPDLLADGFHTADLVKAALGVIVVPLSIPDQPVLLLVLLALIFAAHLLCKRARAPS